MWQMSVPWWEFVLRGLVVYVFLLVFLRLTGKRQTGQYAPFDLVLLLILSNAVQNSMNAGDNSLVGGLISASTRLKEYQAKVKAKVAAAAEDVAKQAKKGGLSDEAAEAIRKQILGIAT